MKLTWHIIKKDLLRLKWVLVLWILLLIAANGMAAIQARLDAENSYPFYLTANVMATAFLPLIAFGLVMGLLHDDPVVEVDAFWITRPISGGDLLIAKAAALILFAMIPVLSSIPFWLSHDYRWTQLVFATKQMLYGYFAVVLLALPIAVLSATASKFVMHVLIGASALFVLFIVLGLGKTGDGGLPRGELVQTKAWIIAVLWMATAIGSTCFQFTTRRTRRTVIVFGISVALQLAVAKWWPVELKPITVERPGSQRVIRAETEELFARGQSGGLLGLIIAEVPLAAGQCSSRSGTTLYVQHVLLDWTGELQVAFSEAEPLSSAQLLDFFRGARLRDEQRADYYILNRRDGRAFPVKPVKQGNELIVATLGFSHAGFATRPAGQWLDSAPENLPEWLKSAALVKVVPKDQPSPPEMGKGGEGSAPQDSPTLALNE